MLDWPQPALSKPKKRAWSSTSMRWLVPLVFRTSSVQQFGFLSWLMGTVSVVVSPDLLNSGTPGSVPRQSCCNVRFQGFESSKRCP